MIDFLLPKVLAYASIAFVIASVIFAVLACFKAKGERLRFFRVFLFRLLLILTLALAYAGPYRTEQTNVGVIPALIDVSDSVDAHDGDILLEELQRLSAQGIKLILYPFAKSVSKVAIGADDFTSYAQLRAAFTSLDLTVTDLTEALQVAMTDSEQKQILLATDGFETRGDVQSNFERINRQGASIFPLTPSNTDLQKGNFRISQVHAALVAPQLATIPIRVTIENTTKTIQHGDLELLQGDRTVLRQSISLQPGSEQVVVAQSIPAEGGIQTITASLIAKGSRELLSERRAYVSSEGREKILLLSGSSDDQRALAQVLENQAYKLDALLGAALPATQALSSYSTIVLNNISLDQLGRVNADRIAEAARAGTGLIMVGGERSFGLGGYRGTLIEEALPVELLPPQREQRRLTVAVMLVIDKSRSMDSEHKMDYAKEAARTFIGNLKDEDYIGVIAFDASPFIVVRLGLLAQIRQMAIDRIGRIFPTGATQPLTAIDEARRALVRVNAGRKHMLFLTDGQIENAGPQYQELIKQMRILGITSSTVMLGPEMDRGFLRSLANSGGGSYYQTNDARSLPRIFLNDVKVASGESAKTEEQDSQVVDLHTERATTTFPRYPNLRGYVPTKLKARATLELALRDGQTQSPLLARWRYGSGEVIAFTSDANGRWSRDWIGWDGFHKFWNQLLTAVRPEQKDSAGEPLPSDLRYFIEGGNLVLEYAIYTDRIQGDLNAIIGLSDGRKLDLPFELVSPGRYRATVPDPQGGRYDIIGAIGNRKTAPVAIDIDPEQFVEKPGRGINLALLHALARRSGGSINPSVQVLSYGFGKEVARQDLSSWFLALAIIFALLEILLREVFRGKRRVLLQPLKLH